jgi:hypothetical protein
MLLIVHLILNFLLRKPVGKVFMLVLVYIVFAITRVSRGFRKGRSREYNQYPTSNMIMSVHAARTASILISFGLFLFFFFS